MLAKTQWQNRVACEECETGWYYFVNTWYFEWSGPPETPTPGGRAEDIGFACYRQVVQQDRIRTFWPASDTVPYHEDTEAHDHNGLGTLLDEPIITMGVKLRGYIGNKLVWYKMIRTPLLPTECEGGLIEEGLWNYYQNTICPMLVTYQVRTHLGELPDRFDCRREVQPMQLRHGTKRRSRTVFGTPY